MLTQIKKPLPTEEACKNENSSWLGINFVEVNVATQAPNSKHTGINPSALGQEAAEHYLRSGGSELNFLRNLSEDISDDPLCRDRALFYRRYFERKDEIEGGKE